MIVHSRQSPGKIVGIWRRPVYIRYFLALEQRVCCLSLRQGRLVIGCLYGHGCTSRQEQHDSGKNLRVCAVSRHWKVFGRFFFSFSGAWWRPFRQTNVSKRGLLYESRSTKSVSGMPKDRRQHGVEGFVCPRGDCSIREDSI